MSRIAPTAGAVSGNRRVTFEPVRGYIQAGLHVHSTVKGFGRDEGAVFEILVARRTAPAEREVAAQGPAQVHPAGNVGLQPLPAEAYRDGMPVIVSSVRRNHPSALDPAMKCCNLLNNALAMQEARAKGALEPVMLNHDGDVAEGAGSNVFLVKDGTLLTPPLEAGILPGVTRQLVLELAASLALPLREEPVAGKDLLAAPRHRSLTAVADWSYQLLSTAEQRAFRRLAVFPGPFTLAAADALAGPEAGQLAARLVDCSLLVPPRPGADGPAPAWRG